MSATVQYTLLPPAVDFRLDCPVYTRTEPDLVPYIAIRHARGRARVNPAALELRQAGQHYQLHVLSLEHDHRTGTRPGASRGVYLTLTAEEAMQARALGVPCREKLARPKAWKPGTVTIQTADGSEEVLASVRRCYAIHRVTVERSTSWTDYETGEVHESAWSEEAYRLTHAPSGMSVWTAKRRSHCEAFADELEESIPELASLVSPLPPEVLARFEALTAQREARR